uniref:Uncharacterized protein n=1 Tax=Arundo donax TaxID=35708 RepID=A0A0A9SV08_ARUDO
MWVMSIIFSDLGRFCLLGHVVLGTSMVRQCCQLGKQLQLPCSSNDSLSTHPFNPITLMYGRMLLFIQRMITVIM